MTYNPVEPTGEVGGAAGGSDVSVMDYVSDGSAVRSLSFVNHQMFMSPPPMTLCCSKKKKKKLACAFYKRLWDVVKGEKCASLSHDRTDVLQSRRSSHAFQG